MKIAYLTPEYPHEKTGHSAGLGSSIKNLVQALVRAGHEITVFVYSQKNNEIFDDNGVTIHKIENKAYTFGKWYRYRKHLQNYCNKVITEQQIAIIEAPDWTGITAFMKFKIPLVIRFHGSDTYFCHLEQRKQKVKNYWFEKLAIRKAKAFIAPTSYAGTVSKRLFHIKNKEIKTIHYGLKLDNFEKVPASQFEDGLILYLGTIIRKKGVLELPEILKQVHGKYPKAHLVLIGGDAPDITTNALSTWKLLEQQFKHFSTALEVTHTATMQSKAVEGSSVVKVPTTELNVTYLGKVPYEAVQAYIKKAHVCVFPTYAETLGMVTIESMAMQKAVVNSNIGWAQELIIDGESGFLVHPANHQEYASKIVELLKNDELRATMGIYARNRVEQLFDIDKKVMENIEFYKTLID
ncbi:glycosyltransferase family 4 protein [Lutibacter sp.]|uniref:glycosyltransferase family 4 protein n=1 Tax=Lutibacter sp. TaxID=1925666 RepID=UPI001A27CF8B|nr:glycosyltransferase family 4 protein [Lutibacter sp.]MBI9042239.1 glycosyltransferase family 4 protein [Lutibacter sp.]